MSAVVSKYGIFVNGLTEQQQNEIKLEYTIQLPISFNAMTSAKQFGYIPTPEKVEVFYTNANGDLVLPRNSLFNPRVNRHIQRVVVSAGNPGEDLPADREFGIELLGNQELVVNHIMTNSLNQTRIQSNMATALLQLGTGAGKTYVGASIIQKIGKKTLWILPNTSILEQTAEVLEIAFPTLKIGRWFSSQKDSPAECHILLVLVDSLLTIAKTGNAEIKTRVYTPGKKRGKLETKKVSVSEWLDYFGLTVFDEVHAFTGKVYSMIFWMFSANIVFSMSATVSENKNGLDEIYKMHYGQEIVGAKIPGFESTDLPWKRRLKVIKYYGPEEYTAPVLNKYNGTVDFFSTISRLEMDPTRNKIIIDCLIEALADGHSVFVFVEHRSHASKLAELYRHRTEFNPATVDISIEVNETDDPAGTPAEPEKKSVVLMGGASNEIVETARTNAQVIFTTYSYCAIGVSIKSMSSLILASPRKSGLTQITGRTERRGGDLSKERVVYDIVDQLSPLNKQFNARKLIYTNKNYTIEEKKIHHDKV